jgi:hypothetical protein
LTTAEHEFGSLDTVMFAGQMATGGCVSFTVTVKLHDAVLPAASVAVQLTGVVPKGNAEPLAGTQATVAPQLSVAVVVNVTTAEHWFGSLAWVMAGEQARTGGVRSHGCAGEALLRGFGAPVAKSDALLSVSVQPSSFR